MNIGITTLVNRDLNNGLGKYIKNLIHNLQVIDKNNRYFILVNKDFNNFLEIQNPNFRKIQINIPHDPRFINRPKYFLWQNFFFKNFSSKYNLDVFHFPNPVPLIVRPNISTIITIHDVAEFVVKRYSHFHQYFRKSSYRSCASRASYFLTVSNYSKKEIIKFLNIQNERISVAYPGNPLIESLEGISNHKSKLEFFLHVGGSIPHKNLKKILKAFSKIEDKEIKLFLVGKIDLDYIREHYFQEFIENRIVVKHGVTDKELVNIYKNSIALLYPSLYEGFGLPIVEAQSLSIPVITSNRGSMREIGKDSVLYVDPTSVDSIYTAMKKVIAFTSSERKRYQSIGKRNSRRFNWNKMAEKTLEVYKKAFIGNNF